MAISGARNTARGRPRVNATPVNVRLPPAELDALDAWIATQPEPRPTRPTAGLASDASGKQAGLSISKVERVLEQESGPAAAVGNAHPRTKPPGAG